MSRKETHMIRSHRSRSGYKPTNKTILNKEAKRRRQINKYLNGYDVKNDLLMWYIWPGSGPGGSTTMSKKETNDEWTGNKG